MQISKIMMKIKSEEQEQNIGISLTDVDCSIFMRYRIQ